MNILDLKKGDLVYGGLTRSGNGFAANAGYQETFEVRAVIVKNKNLYLSEERTVFDVRLSYANGDGVIYASQLFDGCIYATKEDFLNGNDIKRHDILKATAVEKLSAALGLEIDRLGCPNIWEWDATKKKAVLKAWKCNINFADPQLPEGCYATKGECEKANRKMVTIEVTRTYLTEREDGEDAEWLLNHPEEYEYSDGDECISDAKYSD